ncbi:unnamed protein product [Peronospora destructor]|uniref:Uncharacterized protein n=1 Tax=Peronospora destructor TaxID=86335 RepID=A0AAV0URI0_9STRA|nr:unnamed protein product [Peronospora destructor]
MDISVTSRDITSPTNSSSKPSPLAIDIKRKCLIETKETPCQLSSPSAMVGSKESVPEQEQQQKEEEMQGNQEQDELEELEQTLLRKSTGSVAILTRQQEALDHRRHTFSIMSADSRANMRHLTMQSGSTFPLQQPFPHSFKTHHHLQHLRVYDKTSGSAKLISECHEEDASMVAFVSPSMDTVWTRGKPVDVVWKVLDTKVSKLRIELLKDGLSATTLIAAEAPNTGFFTYPKVLWGMESGSKYFLRVSAADDSERYCTSCFFPISSAP